MIEIKQYEPKMTNRFIVRLPEEMNIPQWVISSLTGPKYLLDHLSGRWDDIILEINDPIAPSSSQTVFDNFIRKENIESFDFWIDFLDPIGDVVEQWFIKEASISQIDFGYYDYENNNRKKIKLTIKVKDCILNF